MSIKLELSCFIAVHKIKYIYINMCIKKLHKISFIAVILCFSHLQFVQNKYETLFIFEINKSRIVNYKIIKIYQNIVQTTNIVRTNLP